MDQGTRTIHLRFFLALSWKYTGTKKVHRFKRADWKAWLANFQKINT